MRFSIIVPVYKAEKYLHRCVQSVLEQRFQDYQLILVEDGSPDRCGQMCDAYAEKDSHVTVLHGENAGVSAARNRGIDYAQGEYIVFLDSDDLLPPYFLEEADKLLQNCPGTDLLQFAWTAFEDGQEISKTVPTTEPERHHTKEEALRCFLHYDTFNQEPWGKALHRSLLEGLCFPLGVKVGEDLAVSYRWLDRAKKIVSTKSVGYYYCQRQGSVMSSRKSSGIMDAAMVYEQMWEYFSNHHSTLRDESTNRYACDLMLLIRDLHAMEQTPQTLEADRLLRHKLALIPRKNLTSLVTKMLVELLLKAPPIYYGVYKLRDMIRK